MLNAQKTTHINKDKKLLIQLRLYQRETFDEIDKILNKNKVLF